MSSSSEQLRTELESFVETWDEARTDAYRDTRGIQIQLDEPTVEDATAFTTDVETLATVLSTGQLSATVEYDDWSGEYVCQFGEFFDVREPGGFRTLEDIESLVSDAAHEAARRAGTGFHTTEDLREFFAAVTQSEELTLRLKTTVRTGTVETALEATLDANRNVVFTFSVDGLVVG